MPRLVNKVIMQLPEVIVNVLCLCLQCLERTYETKGRKFPPSYKEIGCVTKRWELFCVETTIKITANFWKPLLVILKTTLQTAAGSASAFTRRATNGGAVRLVYNCRRGGYTGNPDKMRILCNHWKKAMLPASKFQLAPEKNVWPGTCW